jgi:hypothetical protein
MASLASINIRFSANLSEFSKEMQNVARDMKKRGEQMQQIGSAMAIGFTLPILAAGAASVKMASDYEESMNKVNVAFGSSNESVKEFAKNSLESFGIAEGTALDMAALFGDMATSMGLPQQEAANLSTSLVGLAGDLASFKNIGIEQATTALNGVFTGETESLKLLGIVMTEANLAQFALTQGITKSIKEMTQAEKVQLRYAFVMDKTTNAQGDFARTGGGAANQMRVFQERLKELGNQFGQIILPAFTKLITSLNGIFKGFGNLSEGTKTTIVVVAGLVAVVGPLLLAFGTILTFVPPLIAGFAAVKAAFISLSTVIAANPIGAIAVAIGLVLGALYAFSSANDEAAKSVSTLERVNQKAADSVAKERVELDRLLKVARDETKSKIERQNAIKAINKLSPEYLGNLTLETINTDKAKTSIDNYTASLLKKFRVEAAEAELKALANKRFALELGQLKAKEDLLAREAKLRSNSTTLEQQGLQALKDKVTLGGKIINDYYQKEQELLEGIVNGTQELNTEIAGGTAELAKRQKLTAITAPTAATSNGSISAIEAEISKLREFQNEISTTAETWQAAQKAIEGLELQIKIEQEGYASLIKTPELLTNIVDAADVAAQRVALMNQEISDSFTSILEQGVENFAVGFGEIIAGLVTGTAGVKDIGQFLLTSIGDLVIQLGKAAIQIGVTMQAIQASFSSPLVAIAAGIALVAFGTIIKSAVPQDFQRFADGGIVGGSSYYGDKILARVNSGELILNNKQQQALYGMLDSDAAMVNVGVSDIVIDGDKLRIIMDRNATKNNRRK